tara:strand:+ start:167 stop:778 length:612 start_codon:yes stop_codon:yes gene_type:complete
MKSLVLIGNGGHCRSCIEVIESSGEFQIKGLIVHPKDLSKTFMNYIVLGNDENFIECFCKNDLALICIGQIHSPEIRKNYFNLLDQKGISMATIKSKFAIISKYAFVDKGSAVMHRVILNAGVKVGKNCILNTNSLIEHDAIIGNHCHISTGAIINGSAQIGNECFLGSGAIVREGVKIGDKSIISAGQVVMKDLPPRTILRN